LNCFVGHRCGACLEECFPHVRIGSEVQIGEQHHVVAEKSEFLGLGLFHLHDEMGSPGFVSADELCPRVAEGVISDPGPRSGTSFNLHLKSMGDQFANPIGG
jgi:hypothetical protein